MVLDMLVKKYNVMDYCKCLKYIDVRSAAQRKSIKK
jgi:hypothetical protein